jgi:hypothetical protein
MDTRAIVTDPKNYGPIEVEDTIAALQYSHANKLAFTQKSERSIDRRARNRRITFFYHLVKVSGGKRSPGVGDGFDDHTTADAISGKTFKLRRHALRFVCFRSQEGLWANMDACSAHGVAYSIFKEDSLAQEPERVENNKNGRPCIGQDREPKTRVTEQGEDKEDSFYPDGESDVKSDDA